MGSGDKVKNQTSRLVWVRGNGVGSEWVRGTKLKTKPVGWFGLGEKELDRRGFGGQS